MARATYIYVVMQDAKIIGAYTVKHEMLSELPQDGGGTTVWRVRDGRNWDAVEPIDMTDECYE